MILSRNMSKMVNQDIDISVGLYAPVEKDCTSGFVIEVFDVSDKVGADVLLLHGCP